MNELCPVCHGDGTIPLPGFDEETLEVCLDCLGTGTIQPLTDEDEPCEQSASLAT